MKRSILAHKRILGAFIVFLCVTALICVFGPFRGLLANAATSVTSGVTFSIDRESPSISDGFIVYNNGDSLSASVTVPLEVTISVSSSGYLSGIVYYVMPLSFYSDANLAQIDRVSAWGQVQGELADGLVYSASVYTDDDDAYGDLAYLEVQLVFSDFYLTLMNGKTFEIPVSFTFSLFSQSGVSSLGYWGYYIEFPQGDRTVYSLRKHTSSESGDYFIIYNAFVNALSQLDSESESKAADISDNLSQIDSVVESATIAELDISSGSEGLQALGVIFSGGLIPTLLGFAVAAAAIGYILYGKGN